MRTASGEILIFADPSPRQFAGEGAVSQLCYLLTLVRRRSQVFLEPLHNRSLDALVCALQWVQYLLLKPLATRNLGRI